MENIIQVEWTGSYPTLCHGEWVIKYNDIELTIPKDMKYSYMYTFKSYKEYNKGNCNYYKEGLDDLEWIEFNKDWITIMFEEHNIQVTEELLLELFEKIRAKDWRYGSCGGCV